MDFLIYCAIGTALGLAYRAIEGEEGFGGALAVASVWPLVLLAVPCLALLALADWVVDLVEQRRSRR